MPELLHRCLNRQCPRPLPDMAMLLQVKQTFPSAAKAHRGPGYAEGRWMGLGPAPSSREGWRKRSDFLHCCPSAPRPGARLLPGGFRIGTAAAREEEGSMPFSRSGPALPVVLTHCLRFSFLLSAGDHQLLCAGEASPQWEQGGRCSLGLPGLCVRCWGYLSCGPRRRRNKRALISLRSSLCSRRWEGLLFGAGDAPGSLPSLCLTISLPLQDRCLRRRQGRTGRAVAKGCPRPCA